MIEKIQEFIKRRENVGNCEECPINIKCKRMGLLPCANPTCLIALYQEDAAEAEGRIGK